MAKFLIQQDNGVLELEEFMIKDALKRNKYTHSFKESTLKELDNITEKGLIPVGTIDFVTKYLNKTEGFEKETPIEIPWYLQTEEFLKREYNIVDWEKIPRNGKYFLKDVTTLKNFSMEVNTSYLDIDELFNYKRKGSFDTTLVLDKHSKYQVSSLIRIKSEYRIYVEGHEIIAISNYNGDPTLFPDVKLIKKAILLIQAHEKWLKSYTIDIAVGSFGTALLEIHNFTSVGLYNALWKSELPYAYVDGIHYLLNDNSVKYIKG